MIVAMVQIEKSIGGKMMERQFSFVVSTTSMKKPLFRALFTLKTKNLTLLIQITFVKVVCQIIQILQEWKLL